MLYIWQASNSCMFSLECAYIAISIIGNSPSKQQTLVVEYFNVNPTSNFPMWFYIEEAKFHKNHLVLIIQLWSSQILGRDKLIKELFDNCGDTRDIQFGVHKIVWHRPRSLKAICILYFSYEFCQKIRAAIKNVDGVTARPCVHTINTYLGYIGAIMW